MGENVWALAFDGDELVVLRRVGPDGLPYRTVPGGAAEPGTAPERALRRWLAAELGAVAGPMVPVFTLVEAGRTHRFFACRLAAWDPEPRGGEPVRLTPRQAAEAGVRPAGLAGYLAESGPGLAAMLDAVTYAPGRFRPVVDVSLLLVAGDRVLFGQRQGTGYADGEWQIMPSGHLEQGESVARTAIREAREELGIEVAGTDLEFVHLLHHRNVGGTARLGVFFRARRWTGVPTIAEPHKCARLGWFPLDAPPERLTPHTAAVLDGLRAQDVLGAGAGRGGGCSLSGWHQPSFAELEAEAVRAGFVELSVTAGRGRTVVRPGESLEQAVRRAGGAPGRYLRAADYLTPDGRPGRLFHIVQRY